MRLKLISLKFDKKNNTQSIKITVLNKGNSNRNTLRRDRVDIKMSRF